jgi:CubicO group peptidase (beta-lactamase class C family)
MKNLSVALLLLLFVKFSFGQGLNKAALDSIIAESGKNGTDALIISRNGKVIYENRFGKPVREIEAMSATAPIVGLAIGLLIDKGFLKSLDEPVSAFYPEWKQDGKKDITVRHLLTHTSGLQNLADTEKSMPNEVALVLNAGLNHKPGEVYSYNIKALNLLPGIVRKASGTNLVEFLKINLFEPLGIERYHWHFDQAGNLTAHAGLEIYPEDFGKIGQLILNRGVWNGKRIIGENWLNQSFAPNSLNPEIGLLWHITYENQHFIINDSYLNKLKPKIDAATFALLKKLKGRYENFEEIQSKIKSVYAQKDQPAVTKAFSSVPLSEMLAGNKGKIAAYSAQDNLGQYLIILPKKNIVLVRMISAESYRRSLNDPKFSSISELAKKL